MITKKLKKVLKSGVAKKRHVNSRLKITTRKVYAPPLDFDLERTSGRSASLMKVMSTYSILV